MQFVSHSVDETQELARRMAQQVQPGDVILLVGDLGAGKTHFTQGVAASLGTPDVPTSPTFNLVCEYHGGRLPLYHFDLYRLEDASQLDDIDYWGITEGDGVSLVEWGDKFPEASDDACLTLRFSVLPDGARAIEPVPHTRRGEALVGGMSSESDA